MRKKDLSMFYVFLKKSFTILYIVFLVAFSFSVMNVFVVAGPPPSGDWIITETESYSDQVIVLDGNLVIENGGNLTFKNVRFELNCHFDGEYNITVNPGGKFYILDGSVITSHTPSNAYSFFVLSNSTFRISQSELHSAGWFILSDDAVVENCLISNNGPSITAMSDGVVIRNNNITENYGAMMIGGDASIYNNYITKNGDGGINIGGACSPSIYDNIIEYNSGIGIGITNATPDIRNNLITNNGGQGISLHSSSATIFNNTITSNLGVGGIDSYDYDTSTISENIITSHPMHGIYCHENSNAIIRNNTITGNGNGIGCENSNPTIQNNNISQNNNAGISVMGLCSPIIYNNTIISNGWAGIHPNSGANPKIESNTIQSNRIGISVLNASSTISGNIITENLEGGIGCHNYSNPTIANNIITSNPGGNGIHCSYHSDPTIRNNTLTANSNGIGCVEYSNPTIQNNTVSSNQNGIAVGNSNPLIQCNTIFSNIANGIMVTYSNPTIHQNNITANAWGIVLNHSNPSIQGNIITANNEGGIQINSNSNPTIRGNTISQNNESGIIAYFNCSPLIEGNNITSNKGIGIVFKLNCTGIIQGNIIYSNAGYGVSNDDPSITLNATNNYWGSASGPIQSPPDATDPEEVSSYVLYNPWLTEPILIVEITNPLSNEAVSATITVSANVRARNGVQKVEFYIDGLRYTDFESPYEWSWDTTQYAETSHTICVVGYDVFGLENKVSRTVFVDNTYPTVSIKEPQTGITYCGMVTISVNATDNREISSVRFIVDTSQQSWVMTYDSTESLWKYNLNTTTLSDDDHTIICVAIDRAGNIAFASVTINTDNTPPTLTILTPQSGMTVGLTLTIMVEAKDDGNASRISKVEFYLHTPHPTLVSTVNFAPYQWAWDTTRYPNGVYTITVKAYDSIGNVRSRDITVTVNNVEVPWWQANFLAIMQVVIGLVGLVLGIVTIFWSRERKKKKKKEKMTNVSPQENSGKQD